jgi:hypothetical protein
LDATPPVLRKLGIFAATTTDLGFTEGKGSRIFTDAFSFSIIFLD